MNTGSARRGSCGLTGRSDSIFEKSVSSGCAAVRRRVTRDRPPRSPRFPPPRGRRTRRNPVYHDATTARLHVSQHRAYTARRNISHQRAHIVTRPRHASACLCSLVLFLVLFETPPPAHRGEVQQMGRKGGDLTSSAPRGSAAGTRRQLNRDPSRGWSPNHKIGATSAESAASRGSSDEARCGSPATSTRA